jgi:hypothetical protein
MQRACARVYANGMLGLTLYGEFFLEVLNFLAQNELAAIEHILNRSIDFRLDTLILGLQVDERNHIHSPSQYSSTGRPRCALE